MIIFGLMSLLLGALLGGRFKALVLCPATIAVAFASVVRAHLDTGGFGVMLGAITCLAVLLQVGYAAGLACRCLSLASLRAKLKSLIAHSRRSAI